MVVVRLLGGVRAWPDGLAATLAAGRPTVVLGGEAVPDAELMGRSTVPAGVATATLGYLAEGGTANLAELYRFLADTLLLTGFGFAPPAAMPAAGVHGTRMRRPDRPTVGVVFYRAHATSGNTAFVDTLCDALEARGANAHPVFAPSLRGLDAGNLDAAGRADGVLGLLAGVDALVVTVLAAGGTRPSDASAGGDDQAWDVGALATLDVPVVQGLCLTSSRAQWAAGDAGVTPMDAAMQVAIPEFDGRIIAVPFSFKESGADGVPVYAADPERAARLAGIAARLARLRHVPASEKKIALVLSSYPTKHARVGNAVGLDTPASAIRLLDALRAAGYDLGDPEPVAADGQNGPTALSDGDTLIHTLIAAGGHDVEWLSEEQLAAAPARVPASVYRRWFDALPASLRDAMVRHWGDPPGTLYVDESPHEVPVEVPVEEARDGSRPAREPAIVLAALRFGNILLMIQPPRGFGENPVAIYHDPDLPPSHHYLAAYRWLDSEFGADAVVHLGKHGTLEWLPGKGLGLSAGCAPDAVLGDLPLVYPFLVNDPGEGTQAKRRAHAVIVDHLVPPMARADTYGDMAKLEQLLDEHATLAALDPAKLPAVRAQIWTLIQAAQLHHDLGLDQRPGDDAFDDFLLHVDGYLCEVKDTQIRDGLHILGQAPAGAARVNLVLAILRASQVWGGTARALPGLRAALGHVEGGRAGRVEVDEFETTARALVTGMDAAGWDPAAASGVCADVLGSANSAGSANSTGSRRCWCSPRPRWCRAWTAPRTRSLPYSGRSVAGSCRRGRRGHPPAGWSTCCRPGGTSTRSIRRRSRPDWPGRPAAHSPTRCSPATSPTPGAIRPRWD